MVIYQVLLLVLITRFVLVNKQKPLVWAGVYAGLALVVGLAFSQPVSKALLDFLVNFAFIAAWIWLIERYKHAGFLWWGIYLFGILMPFWLPGLVSHFLPV